jgi:hypothetical protein
VLHAFVIAVYFQTSYLRFTSMFQWTVHIPHALGMDFVQRVYAFAKRVGKEQTAARWTMTPFSASQTVQVMAPLT